MQTFGPQDTVTFPADTVADAIKITLQPVDPTQEVTLTIELTACFTPGW